MVEHVPEEDVVAGSSPALGTILKTPTFGVFKIGLREEANCFASVRTRTAE